MAEIDWDQITTWVILASILLPILSSVFTSLGWAKAAATTKAVVRGVEKAQGILPPIQRERLKEAIRAESEAAGTEPGLKKTVRVEREKLEQNGA